MKHLSQNDSNEATILLHIDKYSNIFSDFDARPLVERTLSIDFTEELRRQLYARDESISGITFILPGSERNHKDEEAIKERMIGYFKKHIHRIEAAKRYAILRTALMLLAGAIGMVLASYIVSFESVKKFPYSLIRVLIEPASWFLLWEGMNRYAAKMEELRPDMELYAKITKSHGNINFVSENTPN